MEIFEFFTIAWGLIFSKEWRKKFALDWKRESKSWKAITLFELSMSVVANILIIYLILLVIIK